MNQAQHPCGCIDKTFAPGQTYLFMCNQHLAIANNPEYTQRWRTMLPPFFQQPQVFQGMHPQVFQGMHPQFNMRQPR